jgi:hypothetical protein
MLHVRKNHAMKTYRRVIIIIIIIYLLQLVLHPVAVIKLRALLTL